MKIKNYSYLSEVPDFVLPSKCLINKGKVGCGGTTLAITDNRDTIICVPFVSLVENKCSQFSNLLGVFNTIKDSEIESYIRNNKVKKIICTYDSLERVSRITGFDYYLLIDEYHLLFLSYCFRNKAVKKVLNLYNKFKDWSFMSATPIEDEFLLEELKGIPIFNIEWDNKSEIKVKTIQCSRVLSSTSKIINEFLENKIFGNAHIFVNSVDIIAQLIVNCHLDESNTRVIFSKSNTKYKDIVQGIRNGKTTDKVKKINFYTSTCFEGCDLYDKEGKIYIISSSSKSQTLLDISTNIRQIAGRIRDTKYRTIVHLYNKTRYNNDLTYEEYREICNLEIEKCKSYCNKINSDKELIDGTKESTFPYIIKEDILKFDSNLLKVDLFNFKCTHQIYSIDINSEYSKNNIQTISDIDTTSDRLLKCSNTRTTFKDAILEYDSLITNKFGFNEERIKLLKAKYPYIEDAYKLGMDRLKELNYTNIKRELLKYNPSIIGYLKLNKNIRVGNFITGKELKETTKATLSTIKNYMILEPKQKKINGKTISGYIIKYLKYSI